jgi:hypothetical protein
VLGLLLGFFWKTRFLQGSYIGGPRGMGACRSKCE